MNAHAERSSRSPVRRVRIGLDLLIKEARERQWRRRRRWIVVAFVVALAAGLYGGFGRGGGSAGSSAGHLSPTAPADLPAQPGWFVGSARVSSPGCGRCIQTASWASTIPYRDGPNDFPVRTLKALGPHDVILQVSRSWQPAEPAWALEGHPLRVIQRSIHAGFEGNPTPNRASEWMGESWLNGSLVEVYVWFGTPSPSATDVNRVQAELDLARFPSWRVGHRY